LIFEQTFWTGGMVRVNESLVGKGRNKTVRKN